MPRSRIPVVLYGLGAIGRGVARALARRGDTTIAGAVDRDAALLGRRLGSLSPGGRASPGPRIVGDLSEVPGTGRGRILVHATGSHLPDVAAQIESAVNAGYAVVSSCEELAWPWATRATLARRLDRRARRAGVAILGTGINPGFLLDRLPVFLTAVCRDPRHVLGVRVVDAASRRLPLQRKVGAGLAPEEFRRRVREGRLGHVGLPESAWMIAAGLGWRPDRVTNRVRPVVAERQLGGPVPVRAGRVAGLRQIVVARVGRRERIRLDLTMAVGAADPHDRIVIDGIPPVQLRVQGGIAGDEATVSALVSGVLAVRGAAPGLRSGLDLAPGVSPASAATGG